MKMFFDDFFDDFDLRDINISGSLDQELSEMEKDARRLEREMEDTENHDEAEDTIDEEEDTPEDFDIEDLIP
jgi:hypothetical protein